jgi:phosphoribosylcarboxyaminoimidazole (NCAIR) mutase
MLARDIPRPARSFALDEEDPRDQLTRRLLQSARQRMARLRETPVLSPPLGVRVGILVGGPSDRAWLPAAEDVLRRLGIRYDAERLDPRRAADAARAYVLREESRALEVLIAGAAEAPLLPRIVAAATLLPVLAVRIGPDERSIRTAAAEVSLSAARVLARKDPALRLRIMRFEQDAVRAAMAQRDGSTRQLTS